MKEDIELKQTEIMKLESTKHINLVSLKNIIIWAKNINYGPKSLLKYQLFQIRAYVLTNPGFGPYLLFFDFLGPKKWHGPTATPMGLGPPNPTKKLTHLVDLSGHLLSRIHVSSFLIFDSPLK